MINICDIWYYDESSPTYLRWSIERRVGKNYNIVRAKVGDIAGSKNSWCYQVKYKDLYCKNHRVIWELHHGVIPDGMIIDHLDGNPLNNSISNLYVKTVANNARNKKKSERNTSGETGVSLHRGTYWKAQWYLEDKVCCKYFSIKTYGNEKAKKLASECRIKMIKELTNNGYMYTERHGT